MKKNRAPSKQEMEIFELQTQTVRLQEQLVVKDQEIARQKGINKAVTAALKAANRKLQVAQNIIPLMLSVEAPQWKREDYEHAVYRQVTDGADR